MQPVSKHCGAEQTNPHNSPCRANTSQETKRKRLLEVCAAQQQDDDDEEMAHIADILEQVKSQEIPNSNEGLLVIARTIRHTLIEINEQKEHHRERRHQELMQLIQTCLGDDKVYAETLQKSADASAKSEEEPEYIEALEDIIQVTDGDDGDTDNVVEERSAVQIVERVAAAQRKTLPQTSSTRTFTSIVRQKHQSEFQAMRERMLEMQRQKMEDRERKKQTATQLERQKQKHQQK